MNVANTVDNTGPIPDIVVLGAGIIGVCVALALQRDGLNVTLVDRDKPGNGCSFGNAGLLHAGGCIPLATPSSLRQLPAMLMDPHGALRISWNHLPALMPWLLRMLGQAHPKEVSHNIDALLALLSRARLAYESLLNQTGLNHLVRSGGELYVYRRLAAFNSAQWEMDVRGEKGITVQNLDAEQLRALEPELATEYQYGHYLPDSALVVSPHSLVQKLADYFVRLGGVLQQSDVLSVRAIKPGGAVLQTSHGVLHTSRLVLSAGAWSGRFARQLGTPIPLESWRGYHVMLPHNNLNIGRVVVDGERHIAISPMAEGTRVVGYVELAGLKTPPRPERFRSLAACAHQMYPTMPDSVISTWMGHRPGTPDSLPVIGPLPHNPSIYYAFGHGQLGLTLAAVSGQLVADLVTGRAGAIDPLPYRTERFQ